MAAPPEITLRNLSGKYSLVRIISMSPFSIKPDFNYFSSYCSVLMSNVGKGKQGLVGGKGGGVVLDLCFLSDLEKIYIESKFSRNRCCNFNSPRLPNASHH